MDEEKRFNELLSSITKAIPDECDIRDFGDAFACILAAAGVEWGYDREKIIFLMGKSINFYWDHMLNRGKDGNA